VIAAEDAEQRCLEAPASAGCRFKLSHGLYIGGGEVGIDRMEKRTDFSGDGYRRVLRKKTSSLTRVDSNRATDEQKQRASCFVLVWIVATGGPPSILLVLPERIQE
jgi:hypothetical protein